MRRSLIGVAILAWSGFLITAFYIVQRPNVAALIGLGDTLWSLLAAALLLFNAYGIGTLCLRWADWNSNDSSVRLLLGIGIGLGCQGILGFFFSLLQLANPPVLTFAQFVIALSFVVTNAQAKLRRDLVDLAQNVNHHLSQFHPLAKLAIALPLAYSFLLTLAPQFEAFDALFYHLTQPARILQDGGLRWIDIPHFWFPNVAGHVYLWALAFDSERAAQIIHFTWGVLSALLLWHWAVRTWNLEIGRKTVLLIASIPALPMLASWAYADMALCFYAIAAIFALTQTKTTQSVPWLRVTAILCGLAMGIKYTSFVIPLTCGLLLLFQRPLLNAVRAAAQFSVIATLVASPWYLRNAILMGNPFYPFAFGGRYWDSFLAQWYSGAGTGIGWDLVQLVRLPLDAVLGHRDANYVDGRMGPLFLILLPVTLWILLKRTPRDSAQSWSLISISLFSALNFAAWTVGVVNSSALWQTRLLFPALLPFAVLTALGWHALTDLDTSSLRVSFLVNVLIAALLALVLFENGLFVLARNPLAVAFGAQSREQYIQRVNPSYAELIHNMDDLPADANVYSLFEPRSYSLPRPTQPDAIVANFAHDLHLFKTPDGILRQWKAQGYTHILVYERGLQFMLENNPEYMKPGLGHALDETLGKLQFFSRTPDQVYSIYKIP